MANFTTSLETRFMNFFFTNGVVTQPTGFNVGLWTADPTPSVGPGEVGGGLGYSQQPLTPAQWTLTGNQIQNNLALTFGPATSNWGTISHVVVFDQVPNALIYGAFTVAKTVNTGDTLVIPMNGLTFTVS